MVIFMYNAEELKGEILSSFLEEYPFLKCSQKLLDGISELCDSEINKRDLKNIDNSKLYLTIKSKLYLLFTSNHSSELLDGFMSSLEMYFQDIKDISVLTFEEEKLLLTLIKEGDKKAKNVFVEHNLKLVVTLAKYYLGHGLSMEDLISEGNMGLFRALDSFDIDKGYRFSTYAVPHIKQKMLRALYDKSRSIRVPTHIGEGILQINRFQKEYQLLHGIKPTIEEIALELHMRKEKVNQLLILGQNQISLYTTLDDDSKLVLEDLIASSDDPIEDVVLDKYCLEQVKAIFNKINLSNKEREILNLRYGFVDGRVYTLKEVGNLYGITRERVRQIQARAEKKIMFSPYARELAFYTSDYQNSLNSLNSYKEEYNRKMVLKKELKR